MIISHHTHHLLLPYIVQLLVMVSCYGLSPSKHISQAFTGETNKTKERWASSGIAVNTKVQFSEEKKIIFHFFTEIVYQGFCQHNVMLKIYYLMNFSALCRSVLNRAIKCFLDTTMKVISPQYKSLPCKQFHWE